MERDNQLIDLGAASIETKGPKGDFPDTENGQSATGLTDE